MKTITLLFSTMILCACVRAQDASFGIKAGVNINSLKWNFEDQDDREGNNTGFHAGLIAQFPMTEHFAIQPNLLLSMKGGDWDLFGTDIKTNLLVLEMPINFLYTNGRFFAGGGPSVSFGIEGNHKDGHMERDAYDEYEAGDLKLERFELGVNATIGYRLDNGIFFSGNFTKGIGDIYDGGYPDGNLKVSTRTIGISVGYMFGGN